MLDKVINNYVSRYRLIMYFIFKQDAQKTNEQLGISNKKDCQKINKTSFLIKLLYLCASLGFNGKNTMIMNININNQPCTLTFKINDIQKVKKNGRQYKNNK